jgi:hypothetical protein
MKTANAVIFAAILVAAPSVDAAEKAPHPTEVHGVKLTSICIDCAVVSDIRKETVKGKGSGKHATAETAASGAVAGNESGTGAKSVTVWSTTVVFKNGTTQTYQQKRNPGLQPGDVVTIEAGVPTKYRN